MIPTLLTALLTLAPFALAHALADVRPSPSPREGSALGTATDGQPYLNDTGGGNLDAHDAGFWVFIAIFPALAVISVVTALIILACEGSGATYKEEEEGTVEGDGNEQRGQETDDGGQTHIPIFLGSEIVTVPALETKDPEVTVDITDAASTHSAAPPYQPRVHQW